MHSSRTYLLKSKKRLPRKASSIFSSGIGPSSLHMVIDLWYCCCDFQEDSEARRVACRCLDDDKVEGTRYHLSSL